MALAMQTIVTASGLAAAVDAVAGGLKLRLAHVRLGDGAVAPTEASTDLASPRLGPLPIESFVDVDPSTIEAVVVVEPSEEFRLREIGWFAEDGTLVAVSYRVDGIVDLALGVTNVLSLRLSLIGLPADSVTVIAGAPVLDLAFLGPLASLTANLAWVTQRQVEDGIRLRHLEGRGTGRLGARLATGDLP